MLGADHLVFRATEEVPASCINWLWESYLAAGTLALLDGDPGVGKSFVALDLAARLSAGAAMPGGASSPAARQVLVASAEDVVEDTLIPRFRAAGGVVENLSFFGGLYRTRLAQPVQFPRDFAALERQLYECPCGLVVLDPLTALFPAKVAANNDQSIRAALAPFAALAAETEACFLFVRHLNKSGREKSLYRGVGSIGIAGAVRSGLLAGVHPASPDRRVLSVTKANLGPPGPSLGYRLGERDGGFGVIWDGPTNLRADDLCRAAAGDEGRSRRAEKWLFALLRKGPLPATAVEAAAESAGFGFRTLQTAKKHLRVESRRVKRDGVWCWEWGWPEGGLPPLEPL
jgi:hypothetical protein